MPEEKLSIYKEEERAERNNIRIYALIIQKKMGGLKGREQGGGWEGDREGVERKNNK